MRGVIPLLMHALFEVEEVARHVAPDASMADREESDLHAVRVGLALTGLATGAGADRTRLAAAWRRLAVADADGNLQVLLDGHGVPRGFAVLAFVDERTDAAIRVDPGSSAAIDRLPHGPYAWVRELSSGLGHEVAIARHLRDGILRGREGVGVIRTRADGSTTARRLVLGRGGIGSPRAATPPRGRFNEFQGASARAERFFHYARLLTLADRPISLASAHDDFSHADALQYHLFDRATDPRAYISWTLNGACSPQAEQGVRGQSPRNVERLGDAEAVIGVVDRLYETSAPHPIDESPPVHRAPG